ncbi:MAG: pantetheine-phosphate adenylyltransferase [Cyanobacteria bacterium NC_groundwater_1444_Ag_S-0.65um_54_12]|nr:pantetheine-phosphate adenylyltransferase [Cyanobacteria bacterium NC_groundwater_1444_Ag_S-0.65um_54_12]
MRLAIYPGSFDPVTNGHLDILERALAIFDHVIIAVLVNPGKPGLFSLAERVSMLQSVIGEYPKVTIESFRGLTAEFAKQRGARTLIRGLRAVSDFDAELRVALVNRRLNSELDTIFLMTSAQNLFLSSSTVKEVAQLGGDTSSFVPAMVDRRLRERFAALATQDEETKP